MLKCQFRLRSGAAMRKSTPIDEAATVIADDAPSPSQALETSDDVRRLNDCLGELDEKTGGATLCFFGDGAVAEGAFHESLNLAALWKLPVLFCCENNLFGMGTSIERAESQTDLCVKAASYNMPALRADGMDIVAVHETTKDAVARVRAGQGPVFVEYRTYRFRAHSMFDAELYRQKAEVEEWKTRGPIHTFSARLKAEGKLTEEQFLALDAAANAEVADAVAFAEAGTWEPVEDLLKDVHTPEGVAP